MKHNLLKVLLVLFLLSSGFTQIAVAEETNDIALKAVSKLRTDKAYIFGSFFEKRLIGTAGPFVKMQIQNIDTGKNYLITFSFSKKLKIYSIPVGKYKIDSFWVNIERTSKNVYEKTYLKLEENEKLYEDFDIKSGDLLYLGAYSSVRAITVSPRTAKVTRDNDFANAEEYIKKFHPDSFNIKNLSETTIKLEPITFTAENESNQSAYLAGRFITDSNSWSTKEIEITNLWTKEKLKIKFVKNTEVRLFQITHGEYVINDIIAAGHHTEKLLPESWLLPFLVKPGEVLYLGNLMYQEQTNLARTIVTTSFLNDFDSSKQDITSLLESNSDYKINAIDAEEE